MSWYDVGISMEKILVVENFFNVFKKGDILALNNHSYSYKV